MLLPLTAALFLAAGLGGCGDDPAGEPSLGRTVYVDAAVAPGGSGRVDDPVASLAEAVAIELDGEGEVTFILADGTYDVPASVGDAAEMRWVGGTTPGTVLVLGGASLETPELRFERLTLSGDAVQVGTRAHLLDVMLVDGETSWAAADLELNRVSVVDATAALSGEAVTVLDAQLERGRVAIDSVQQLVVNGVDATEGRGPLLSVNGSSGVLEDVRVVDAGFLDGAATDVAGDDRFGSALMVTDSEIEMQDIYVERPLLRGLFAEGSELDIADSEFRGGGRAALALVAGEDGSGAYSLTASEVADAAILVFSRGPVLTISDSFFSGGGTAGVLASGGVDLNISTSTFLDCPNGHISLLGDTSRLTFDQNVVRGAVNESCVSVSSTTGRIVVSENTVSSCAGAGISTLGVVDALIERNDVSDIAPSPLFPVVHEGISLVQSVATIRGNNVHDFAGTGIALLDSGGVVEENTCSDLGGAGIRAVERGTAPLESRANTISRANVAGIFIFNVEGTSEGDVISDTRFDVEFGSGTGIAVSGPTSFSISNATISASSQHGIYVDSETTLDVSDSAIDGSVGFAIACASGAALTTTANTYANNTFGDEDPRCFAQ